MPEAITYAEHAQDVLSLAVDLLDRGQRFVLVTSIDIKGGAAREVGTLAIVEASGAMTGYMSNGCIDSDIRVQAQTILLERGGKRVLRYGEGSPFLDLTLPCGGALELLLDPECDAGQVRAAHAGLLARRAVRLTVQTGAAGGDFAFDYDPKPRLALAGRGAVFRAMARVAAAADFELHLYSPETADLAALADLAAPVAQVLTTPNAVPALALDPYSAFLTLFHDHDWEPALLAAALETEARFIGCLGSQRTHALRLEALRAAGVAAPALARITGPLGLVPSLRQAPLIAASTMAQLAGVFPRAIHSAT